MKRPDDGLNVAEIGNIGTWLGIGVVLAAILVLAAFHEATSNEWLQMLLVFVGLAAMMLFWPVRSWYEMSARRRYCTAHGHFTDANLPGYCGRCGAPIDRAE